MGRLERLLVASLLACVGSAQAATQVQVVGLFPGAAVLNVDGLEQPYYVDFDVNGRVDSKGFMTCEQHQGNQRKRL